LSVTSCNAGFQQVRMLNHFDLECRLINRYIPPDYNPKETSTLNKAAGKKHALGNRAKDIDKGILIVRYVPPLKHIVMMGD
jgi:hypothetical protein